MGRGVSHGAVIQVTEVGSRRRAAVDGRHTLGQTAGLLDVDVYILSKHLPEPDEVAVTEPRVS